MNATETKRNKKGRPKGAAVKFPGIGEDAKILGVNRVTLFRTLSGAPGFDGLKTLRRRYDELLATKPRAVREYINANKAWKTETEVLHHAIGELGKAFNVTKQSQQKK